MFSEKDNYIVVNYHYVRDLDPNLPSVHPCSVGDFEKQVKFLVERYRIVSVPEVYEAARRGESGRFCALTFDDGQRDNYQNAFPILGKYKIQGTFFIPTMIFDGLVPSTHKIHTLLSIYEVSELVLRFNQWANGKYKISTTEPLDSRRRYGDLLTNNFKEVMMRLPIETKTKFLSGLLKETNINEADLNRQLFMSAQEIQKLYTAGMKIACHSHLHESLEFMDRDEIKGDLIKSKQVLGELVGENIDVFSYPHGRHNPNVLGALSEVGFRYAATVEPRGIQKSDSPFLIPRYDTKNLRFID